MMKRFLLSFFLLLNVSLFAQDVPNLAGYITDNANVLSPKAETTINSKLLALDKTDSTQIAVLTIKSLEGYAIEDYSIKVVDKNQIGDKGFDNGVLFLISMEDKRFRIEVGYGLEGVLTDLTCSKILRNIVSPYFKSGNYEKGIEEGVDAIIKVVSGEYSAKDLDNERVSNPFFIIFMIPILIIMLIVFIKHPFLFLLLLNSSHRGGGSFGGGSSFGGFGGGSFGGGGASGGW